MPPKPSPADGRRKTDEEHKIRYGKAAKWMDCDEVEKDDLFFLPNNAIRRNDRLDDRAEFDSCSDIDDLDVIEDEEEEETVTLRSLVGEMWKIGIDFDFRFFDKDLLYKDKNEAAAFTPMTTYGRPVEIPSKVLFDYHSGYTCMDMTVIAGDTVHVCAEEHEVLLVGREEDKEWVELGYPTGFHRSWKYVLCRREITTRQMYSSLGLLPSAYIVPETFYNDNKAMFIDNWWWLGVCSYDDAFQYLTSDRYAQCEGLFVIFSPRWLNIKPKDYRPYVLMALTPRNKETEKVIAEMGQVFGTNILPTHLQQLHNRTDIDALKQLKGREMPSTYHGEGNPVQRMKIRRAQRDGTYKPKKKAETKVDTSSDQSKMAANFHGPSKASRNPTVMKKEPKNKIRVVKKKSSSFKVDRGRVGEQTVLHMAKQERAKTVGHVPGAEELYPIDEPTLEQFIHAGTSLYAVQTYTIQRSRLGHYELMDRRFATLYDLVWNLSQTRSHLPCRLVFDGLNVPPPFAVTPMESPPHQKSPYGLPMNCEQWAAMHYRQSTEPKFQHSPISYCIRSFVDPIKDKLWKLAGLTDKDVSFNLKAFQALGFHKKNDRNKDSATRDREAEELLMQEPFQIPNEEHMMSFDPKIVIPGDSLKLDMNHMLGSGQFGSVYKGLLKQGNEWKNCVVKQFDIRQTDVNGEMAAFAEEIDVTSAVHHPNVVGFYGVRVMSSTYKPRPKGEASGEAVPPKAQGETSGEDMERDREDGEFPQGVVGGDSGGTVLMAIELCSAGSFESYLAKRSDELKLPLTNNEVIDWMSQIARGLSYLHTRVPAIAHGDMAVRNILMSHHPTNPKRFVMKVSDLGLAKFMRPDSARLLHGSTLPMIHLPPECAKRRELSPAADVWSFGCTLGEIYGKWDPGVLMPGGLKGYYASKPKEMPVFLYALYMMCRRDRPHDRISMDAADKYLCRHWIQDEGIYIETVYGGKRG